MRALEDTLSFEKAVIEAVRLTNEDDTLIIVTADHSHPFSLTGYTGRGNDVLGNYSLYLRLQTERIMVW